MKIDLINITSRTATFERDSKTPYYADKEFEVLLNGQMVLKSKKNVFTLFNLTPNTKYVVEVEQVVIEFTTKEETALLDVTDFFAVGDGVHNDTGAIQAAIYCCPPGGTIYIPKGVYHITTLFLKSDTMIYLEKDAVLSASYQREEFPVLPGIIKGTPDLNLGTWEGAETSCFASTITGYKINNFILTGEGTIDENAIKGDWYQNHRERRIAWRPFGMFLNRCENVVIEGITICNSPSWNVHPYFSKHLKFLNISITNPPSMPTTDGLDPDCCEDVKIIGVFFSVGDDCIAIKSGTLDFAKKYQTPSQDILIRNCLMQEGHGGVVFGSELSSGINRVKVHSCLFVNTDRGLRIKTRRGRGRIGTIDDIDFDNIVMKNVKTPLVINMFYNMGPKGGHEEYVYTEEELPVDERTPLLGKFHFKNMVCDDVSYTSGIFLGLPEAKIKEITLENIVFNYKKEEVEPGYPVMREINKAITKEGLIFSNVEKVVLKNIELSGQIGDKHTINKVDTLEEN